MLPVIISYSPNVSEFDGGSNCLAEEWVRAGTETEGTGAIAFYGSAVSDCWCPWPMEGMIESVELLVSNNTYNSLGSIIYNGTLKVIEGGNHKWQQMHLFGDPSLLVYTQKPTPLTVSHPATVNTGEQTVTVSSEDSARVCLYSKEQDIHEYTSIINNSAQFKINVTTMDTILVTGTKRNRIPYLGHIIVDPTDNNLTQSNNNNKDLVQLNVTNNNIHFLYNGKLPSDIQLSIFSIAGKLVYSKQYKQVKKGFSWNLINNRGYKVSAGVYVAILRFGNSNSKISSAYFNIFY